MNILARVLKSVDGINKWCGYFIGVVLILLMLLVVGDVILRYLFNRPIAWGEDVKGLMLLATTFLAGGYALLHEQHVRVDILYSKLPTNGRIITDLITFPLLFIICAVLLWQGGIQAWKALEAGDMTSSVVPLPLWPGFALIPVGGALIGLQGLARWIRGLSQLLGKSGLESEIVKR